MCVNNLPRVALDSRAARIRTCDLLHCITFLTWPKYIAINFKDHDGDKIEMGCYVIIIAGGLKLMRVLNT